MSSRQIKNTRLFYNDEKNLKIYQALSAEDFKELFMACLTYKVGSDVEITDFSSPSLYGLFMMYKDKIDYNETKWLNSGNASRENGKKGGRPKKQTPIEPNDDFNVEPVEKIPCNVEPQEEQINNNNNPKPEEDMGNPTNIIVSNGKAVIVNEPAVEYRTNSNSISNRIQHLINNDDNFYNVFTNCTKQIAYYKINDTNICASNSIEMAYDKLERMFDEYHIPFNTEANDFIISEVEEIININYN